MRCEEAKEQLQDYLDGLLPEESRKALEEHLKGCSVCASEFDGLRRVVDALRSLPKERAPEVLKERIERAVMDERLSFWRTFTAVSTAAAALLLALLIFSFYWQPIRHETPPEPETALGARHKPPAEEALDEADATASDRPKPLAAKEERRPARKPAPSEEMRKKLPPAAPGLAEVAKDLKEDFAKAEGGRMRRMRQKVAGGESVERLEEPAPLPAEPSAKARFGARQRQEEKKQEKEYDKGAVREKMASGGRGKGQLGGRNLPDTVSEKLERASEAMKELQRQMDELHTERKIVRVELSEDEAKKLLMQLSSLAESDEKVAKRSEVNRNGLVEVLFETDERGWRNLYSILEPERSLSDEEAEEVYAGRAAGKHRRSKKAAVKLKEDTEKKIIKIVVIVIIASSEEDEGSRPSAPVK